MNFSISSRIIEISEDAVSSLWAGALVAVIILALVQALHLSK